METGKIEYTRQWCKYEFSRDEMHEIAETLATIGRPIRCLSYTPATLADAEFHRAV